MTMSTTAVNVHSTPFLGPLIDVTKYSGVLAGPTESPLPQSSGGDATAEQSKVSTSGRIIHATTNLPHVLVRSQGKFTLRQRRGNSALFSAINYLNKDTDWDTILVAWTGEVETPDSEHEQEKVKIEESQHAEFNKTFTEASGVQTVPVWLPPDSHWRGYAEHTIWPALHYIEGEATDGREEKEWWDYYLRLNEAYRDVILATYKPGDIIWIHDYYLLLLPQLIRQKLPDAYIGLFMHAPFPSSEYFKAIARRKELLEGMLGANTIGFHSYAYKRHFISSATRLLGVESSPNHVSAFGVHVAIETLPIGIDTVMVDKTAFQPSVDEKVEAIRALYPGKKIIVGRDRLDSVRGVVQKLQAFETFLREYPEWRDQVVLIQVTSPAYSNPSSMDNKVSEIISRINGTYGQLHFAPVHHYPRHIAKDEYLALLRVADLGLITSVRDGMNTTSLEFAVCQKFNKSPLILSEFTGTAGSLTSAVQVNPWDATEVAATINECLNLPEAERAAREKVLYEYVTTNTVQNWVSQFISRLLSNLCAHDRSHVTPMLDVTKLLTEYKKAKKRLFLFDYDGTLTPIVKEPSAAIPSTRLYSALQRLSDDPNNIVWIISGRDAEFLDKWLGAKNKKLNFSAEHGCFLKQAGAKEWTNLAVNFDMSWQKTVYDIFQSYTERTQGASIEHKRAALTWHYRRADPEFGQFQSANLRQHLEETVAEKYGLEVMAGKANVEVRPRQFNKGEIVRRILKSYGEEQPEFVICLGDDYTDEDMFKALLENPGEGVFPVTVGPPSKMTVARYHLLEPAAVLDTLETLLNNPKHVY